jgi:site-specific DNA-methyltransferase (adenine-specific)
MAHLSEDSHKLELRSIEITETPQWNDVDGSQAAVYMFWLPSVETNDNAVLSKQRFERITHFCKDLHKNSTVCILATPPDAASLLLHLGDELKFQYWIVVKTCQNISTKNGQLPNRHVALLILTRYNKYLRHAKTRIKYAYCTACGKTTKDYGGKKHMCHEYGTLMSDVWRDIECDPSNNIDVVTDRLCDLLGVGGYKFLYLVDLHRYKEFLPKRSVMNTAPQAVVVKDLMKVVRLDSKLINDDCLKALRKLPDNSVDFCFADLPYNLKKKYYRSKDELETSKYFDWCDKWLTELYRVLKPGRTLAVLNIPLWSVRHYQYLSSIMNYQAWIAWDALSFPARKIMPAYYAIVCFSKGTPRPIPGLSASKENKPEGEYLKSQQELFCFRSSCMSYRRQQGISDRTDVSDLWHDVHRLKHNSRRVNHPCQLPPLLMRRLFALFTNKGEIILDCFNGTGTSTLVAQQMDRRFIGIELSSRYYKIAVKRHEQITQGDDPFGKVDTIPAAKNRPIRRLSNKEYKVTKKVLQLDVKRIATELGRLPKREDVKVLSNFPIRYFDKYFINWSEVCAAARTTGMSEIPIQSSLKLIHGGSPRFDAEHSNSGD